MIGFLATTLAVGSFLSGQNKWILAAAIGVAGGAIIGRLWKPILALAAVAGGLWIFSRTPRDAPSGATPSDPGAWSAATPPSAPIYNNTYTQPPPAPPPAAQARAPSPPPTPADPPRARRTLPPPADQFPGGAANAFLNDTEAVYNVDRIVDDDQITIRHVREIAQDELRLVTYDAHAGQAWVLYPDNTPFPLGLSIDPADRDAWSRAKLVWFLKVTPQDTRVPSDPSFALLLRQAPQ